MTPQYNVTPPVTSGFGLLDAPAQDPTAAMMEALRRAVLTLRAVPDPDHRFLRFISTAWPLTRDDVREAYGWKTEDDRPRFRPTPRDVQVYLDVLAWLAWYEREKSEQAVRVFVAWAVGGSWVRLAKQFDRPERALRNEIDDLCRAVAHEYETGYRKLFLINAPERNVEAEPRGGQVQPRRTYEPAWHAPGERSSGDWSQPHLAELRDQLLQRLEDQRQKRVARERREKRAAKSDAAPKA